MKQHRIARVSEAIREVAAETILFQLQDPRIKNVTVTRAEVSADLQKAKVYVSVMGTQKEQDLCMHGLKHSAGFLQSKIACVLATALHADRHVHSRRWGQEEHRDYAFDQRSAVSVPP